MSEVRPRSVLISLNGDDREIPAGLTVRELLSHLDLNERLVVVERNRGVLRRAQYRDVQVRQGDEIELVHFVGGG